MRYSSAESHSASDLTAAQATGAHVDVLRRTVHYGLDALDIGLPCAVGTSVRVADLDAEGDTLLAKFTLCHLMLHLLAKNLLKNSFIIIPEDFPNCKQNFMLFSINPGYYLL